MANTLAPAAVNHVMNGSAKFWANINAQGTGDSQSSSFTPAARDSFNLSSITDHSTGQFTIAVSNNMANDDFAAIGSGTRSDTVGAVAMVITPRSLTTSGFRFTCEYNNGDVWDFKNIFLSILGDL